MMKTLSGPRSSRCEGSVWCSGFRAYIGLRVKTSKRVCGVHYTVTINGSLRNRVSMSVTIQP